jgi:hypothetical protein
MTEHIKRACIVFFFSALLILGLKIYPDYGISEDEPQQRGTGAFTVIYLAKKFHFRELIASLEGTVPSLKNYHFRELMASWENTHPSLENYRDRDYGVVFEAPAVVLEQLLRLKDIRQIYMLRHLLTFLVFVGGVYAVYRLSYRRFSDWRLGLLSALFIVVTPRFFAESFYNSKDIVFMAAFAAAMNTSIAFILYPRIQTALLNALATAVAIDIRIMAVLLPVVSVALLIMRLTRHELPFHKAGLALGLYIISTFILVVLMWPYLWSNPIANFMLAFKNMAAFRWQAQVRYMGAFPLSTALPWHYTLTWISITTPLFYLALFFVGLFAICRQIVVRRLKLWQTDGELQDIVCLLLFCAPVAAVIIFHSVLYDGWRQMYFLYPAFLLIATKGWVLWWSIQSTRRVYKTSLLALTSISIVSTATWMWNAHPLQNIYFNMLAGKNRLARYEMDYWGLANRKALEYILENDDSPLINIWTDSDTNLLNSFLMLKPEDRQRVRLSTPLINVWAYRMTAMPNSFLMLKPEDRQRVRLTNDKLSPCYVLTNYRAVKDISNSKYDREYDLFYDLRVDNQLILSVFKLRSPMEPQPD